MRNLALVLVFVALLIGLVVALIKIDSRFAVGWDGAGTIAALSLPAAVLGEWLAAGAFVLVGLIFTAGLVALDRRDRREGVTKTGSAG